MSSTTNARAEMNAARHVSVLGGRLMCAPALLCPIASTRMGLLGFASAWNTCPCSHADLEAPGGLLQESSGPRLSSPPYSS
eukprot:4356091-Lingulodinium_polyedra.AAC.1